MVHEGYSVSVVDSLDPRTGSSRDNLPVQLAEKVTIREIADPTIWENLPPRIDVVANFAGLSGHAYSMTHPQLDLEANLVQQAAFLEGLLANGHQPHVLLASTRQVYGTSPTKSRRLHPADVNAVGRLAVEQLHEVMLRGGRGSLSVLRLSNVYGPAMLRSGCPQGVLGTWLRAAARAETLTVTTPTPIRDLLHVEDLTDLLLEVITDMKHGERRVETLDVGGGQAVPLDSVAEYLASITLSRLERVAISGELRSISVGDYVTDLTAIQARYAWVPQRDWREQMELILRPAISAPPEAGP